MMNLFWFTLVIWQLALNDADPLKDMHHRVSRQTGPYCTTPSKEFGICIDLRQCESLFTMLKEEGRDPRIVAFLKQSRCGGNSKNPRVCCSDGLEENRSTLDEIISTPPNKSQQPKSTVNFVQPTKSPFSNYTIRECGKSKLEISKVVGGKDAALGNWPWMAGLSYRIRGARNSAPNFKCGATLISAQWVITAAHCFVGSIQNNLELNFVRLGDLDLNDSVQDGAQPIDAQVDRIVVHPQYSNSIKQNDITLLHLKEPVQFSETLHPICLLSGEKYRKIDYYARKLPYIIGWGATGWLGKSSSMLQEARVKIVEPTKCAEQYAKVTGALINDQVLCAWDRGKDTCQGDSGGPLIFPEDKLFYLGGIVSYGIGCNTTFPGVYTRISEYIDWINSVTEENF